MSSIVQAISSGGIDARIVFSDFLGANIENGEYAYIEYGSVGQVINYTLSAFKDPLDVNIKISTNAVGSSLSHSDDNYTTGYPKSLQVTYLAPVSGTPGEFLISFVITSGGKSYTKNINIYLY